VAAARLSTDPDPGPAPSASAPTGLTAVSNEELGEMLRRVISGSSGGRLENIHWDPDDRSLDLDSWLLKVEQSFEVHAPGKTPEEQTKWAALQLQGRAAKWWNAMVRTGVRDTIFNSPNAWTVFVDTLNKEFQLIDSERFYRDRLWSIKQGDSSVQRYVEQLRGTAIHIPHMLNNDREMLDRFEQGLNNNIKAAVRQAGAKEFDEAVKIANACYMATNSKTSPQLPAPRPERQNGNRHPFKGKWQPTKISKPTRSTCHNCGKPGHYAKDCRSRRTRSASIPFRPQILERQGPPTALKCYNCGKPGHTANVCRSRSTGLHNVNVHNHSRLALEAPPNEDEAVARRNWFDSNNGK